MHKHGLSFSFVFFSSSFLHCFSLSFYIFAFVLFMYIGQFWNMPVDISPYNETTPDGADLYIVNITVGGTHRNYVGVFSDATWEDDEEDCLYVGNAQAGPDGQGYSFNDAAIAGNYENYSINEAFSEIDYEFGLFREDLCNTGSGSGSGNLY